MFDHRTESVKPRVSVILLTYCQSHVVKESLMGFFAQDYNGFQLVISDDASSDETWLVIEEMIAHAPSHIQIRLNRNTSNLGIIGNYMAALQLCDGDLVFSAAGDDIPEPHRISSTVTFWQQCHPTADLIATDLFDMSVEGRILGVKTIDDLQDWDWRRWMHVRPYHAGASHMVTRRLLNLGPLNANARNEDQCLFFRSLLLGGAARLPEPLVRHRRGGVSSAQPTKLYDQKRNDLLHSSQTAIAEYGQNLSDAKAMNAAPELIQHLQTKIETAQYICQCLQPLGHRERMGLLLGTRAVSLRARLRFFVFATFFRTFQLGYFIKKMLKGH